jgi:NADPH-dependent curcumin reductase CurA
MKPGKGYVPGYEINGAVDSYGVSEIVSSKNAAYPVGSIIYGTVRWEEYSVLSGASVASFQILPKARELANKIPLSNYVGILGMPGLTAYGSLKAVAKPKAGETIYISAASGAVGQLVGQLAKLQGLRVVGSAGSDAKVDYLIKELKFDAAFNYKNGPILDALRKAAPEGIDIYYDNVGAEHLEAALEALNKKGRVVGK